MHPFRSMRSVRIPRRALLVGAVLAGVGWLLWLVLVAAPLWFIHNRSLEGLKAQTSSA